MGRRILSITFAVYFCLLAARPVSADTIDFQTAIGSGGSQTGGTQTQSGGAQTPPSGGGTTATQVQTVDLGDVTGTVCDCGEIPPAGDQTHAGEQTPGGVQTPGAAPKGGFPKFPLFAFALGAPLICFSGICTSTPPNPPENPPEVPEPLTLATFAAGLAALAGLRARRGK